MTLKELTKLYPKIEGIYLDEMVEGGVYMSVHNVNNVEMEYEGVQTFYTAMNAYSKNAVVKCVFKAMTSSKGSGKAIPVLDNPVIIFERGGGGGEGKPTAYFSNNNIRFIAKHPKSLKAVKDSFTIKKHILDLKRGELFINTNTGTMSRFRSLERSGGFLDRAYGFVVRDTEGILHLSQEVWTRPILKTK